MLSKHVVREEKSVMKLPEHVNVENMIAAKRVTCASMEIAVRLMTRVLVHPNCIFNHFFSFSYNTMTVKRTPFKY